MTDRLSPHQPRCPHGTLHPHRCRECEDAPPCSKCDLCERCKGAGCVMCDGAGVNQYCDACRQELRDNA